ncbi:hypothetical protein CCACVL1_27978 [Corchorus capsularis]|uniref:Uncharacterized protein n=1 Tax=Corchorus capsularis TaxID=210143 RepID=A0A1R3G861_COCAP|nr:hypothetical protein CCACVL1_27978 [Corchorus capsularis]
MAITYRVQRLLSRLIPVIRQASSMAMGLVLTNPDLTRVAHLVIVGPPNGPFALATPRPPRVVYYKQEATIGH